MTAGKVATVYRMVLADHTCPYGLRALELLQQHGFHIEDKVLSSRQQVDAFEAEHAVDTTPQIFIDGERIGGCDDLERRLAGH